MNQIINLFDAYNIRVRFSAGLILISPIIISVYLLVPNASNFSFTAIILVICFGLCNLMMSLSRFWGRNVPSKCFSGLMPAQQLLMPDDETLDPITKKRYYKFLCSNVENLSFTKDIAISTNSCKSAVNWLISQTRDSNKFPLIKEETINFGFSKTLYGLKPLGIVISLLLTIIEIIIVIAKINLKFNYITYADIIAATITSCIFTIIWIFFIKKEWVTYSGYKYAKTLLSACDSDELSWQ